MIDGEFVTHDIENVRKLRSLSLWVIMMIVAITGLFSLGMIIN